MPDFSKQLSKYIPEAAAPIISQWINDTACRFKVTKSRSSKLGDYRSPFKNEPHQITINHDLNPFSFLITTVHEFAHLKTWQNHKNKVRPHGTEWKNNFKGLMDPFIRLNLFPADVTSALVKYMNNPAASSCTDLNLYKTLKNYDSKREEIVTIDTLEFQQYFSIKSGRIFQKQEKLRKRYKCLEVSSQRIYLFHPIAEVFPIEKP
ncbi:sprT domain-containing protein [Sphingobacterium sp. CZ-2]|uniref:sprT domain-containing protein n=1 Tax=Sphingobacterium sp. CZ-2 TaxID=2557994 RepID=UPI00106F6501|nr:sprT domain-containing protein [Sphingobacterium sp. CZ-2]QBR12715.1 sprT domain-containing protein [Sphingobacterium sp. CZ-2]